ncbi:MAG: hypothetical protein ACOYO1_02020 [Bacteroidales bacterium]
MQNSNNISDEIIEMAPFLSNIKKENSFQASDQYFDALSSKIQLKITKKKTSKTTVSIFSLFQKPQFAIAASFLVILSISLIYFYPNNSKKVLAQNNTIYWDEILNENNNLVDKIDEALLVEVLSNEVNTKANHEKDNITHSIQTTLDEVSDEVESAYNNDIFNEL